MTGEQFDALVELIRELAREAVTNARPAHDRRAETDGGEGAIFIARLILTDEGAE